MMARASSSPKSDVASFYPIEIETTNRVSFSICMIQYDGFSGIRCLIFAQLYLNICMSKHIDNTHVNPRSMTWTLYAHISTLPHTYICVPILMFDNNCILYIVFTLSDKIVSISTQYIHPAFFPGWRIIASNMILRSAYPSIYNAAVHHHTVAEIKVSLFLYMILYHNCCLIVVALSIWFENILPHG